MELYHPARRNTPNWVSIYHSYTGQVFCTVGNAKSIFATGINLKGMNIKSMALIITENKIATPGTATWHVAIATIF
jgi:hypothetical protein